MIQWQPIQGRDVWRGRYLLRQPNCLYYGNRHNKPGFVVELKAAQTVDVNSDVQKEGMAMLMWYLVGGGSVDTVLNTVSNGILKMHLLKAYIACI